MQPENKNVAPTAQKFDQYDAELSDFDKAWLSRARAAFASSTTFFDLNVRKEIEDSIRMFNNQHPSDSKYNDPQYQKRSKLFRPKIRSIIRKNEAAAAAAFFSNMDVVNVEAMDPTRNENRASAEVMKMLLQQRLTKTIPWYQILLGGLQDAQNTGFACAHIYWKYVPRPKSKSGPVAEEEQEEPVSPEEEYPEQSHVPAGSFVAAEEKPEAAVEPTAGPSVSELPNTMSMASAAPAPATPPQAAPVPGAPQPQAAQQALPGIPKEQEMPLKDEPCVDLIPLENLRIDPSANWLDPVNTSPYVIQLIPMYTQDVRDCMTQGIWRTYPNGTLRQALTTSPDSIRTAREGNKQDRMSDTGKELGDYEVIWVQRHIHRKEGEDWEFYTLGDLCLLTDPRPLREAVFYGKRPYVIGRAIIEAHKLIPSSIGKLGRGLQDEANEIANQRIDNVKFVLNKKYILKRGKDADIAGLVRNVPGGVVMADDPEKDVREMTWPDVTSSAYEEQARIDQDLNDLLGNFSAAQVMADHGINGPARNMSLLNQNNATLVEYMLRTFVETFVQPVLEHLVQLEQKYETDQTLIALAAQKASIARKYGIDEVTDQILEKDLVLSVNVGMGATDPITKLQRLAFSFNVYLQLRKMPLPDLNMFEIGKEVLALAGYKDAARFFISDNPEVQRLQGMIQQMNMKFMKLTQQVNDRSMGHQVKLAVTEKNNEAKDRISQRREEHEDFRAMVAHHKSMSEIEKQHAHELSMERIRQSTTPGKRKMKDGPDAT